jgi:hypothetical protein
MGYNDGMGFKTGVVTGVVIGYLIATRLDPGQRQRIESVVNKRIAQLREDPRVRDVMDSVSSITNEVVERVEARTDS